MIRRLGMILAFVSTFVVLTCDHLTAQIPDSVVVVLDWWGPVASGDWEVFVRAGTSLGPVESLSGGCPDCWAPVNATFTVPEGEGPSVAFRLPTRPGAPYWLRGSVARAGVEAVRTPLYMVAVHDVLAQPGADSAWVRFLPLDDPAVQSWLIRCDTGCVGLP